MDNLFNAQVSFNSRNPNLVRGWDDVILKYLNDKLDEINQRLSPGDIQIIDLITKCDRMFV